MEDAVPPRVSRRRSALQLLGLPRRRLPPAPRHAHRPRARNDARRRSRHLGRRSTATPGRAPARPIMRPLIIELRDSARRAGEFRVRAGARHRTPGVRRTRRGPRSSHMSLVRFLPAWFHAIADYAVGIGLIVVALAVGRSGIAVATGVVVGAVVLVVGVLTTLSARRRQGAAVHTPLRGRLPRGRAARLRAVRARLHRHRRWARRVLRGGGDCRRRGESHHELPVQPGARLERLGARPRSSPGPPPPRDAPDISPGRRARVPYTSERGRHEPREPDDIR